MELISPDACLMWSDFAVFPAVFRRVDGKFIGIREQLISHDSALIGLLH